MQFGVNLVGAGILTVHLRRPLNLVISARMGMSYRQAEEELFRRLKRKRLIEETEDD